MALSWHLLGFIPLVAPDPILALLFWGWPTKGLLVVYLFIPGAGPSAKGKHAFSPSYCSCHRWGPKDLADPFCTPQVSLADVCVSCPLSMSTATPISPQSWCWDTVSSEGRNHTPYTQFWCLWIQFSSDTTYLEIESNFKVKIQPQETAFHFRCQLQTQVLPVFVTNWLQTRGL